MTSMRSLIFAKPMLDAGKGSGRFYQRYQIPMGILAIGVIVLWGASTLDSAFVFTLNAVLLACMGAIALTVLMGTAGQVSIGNAAFLGIGGFSAVFFARSGFAFPFDVVLATVVSGVAGLVVGLPALRLRGLYLALATLAAQFIVIFLGTQYQNNTQHVGGFSLEPVFASFEPAVAQQYWSLLLWAVLGVVIVGAARLMRGKSGRALRIIRDHEPTAPSLGIPVTRYKLTIFALASAVIGAQGALAGHLTGFVSVDAYTVTIAIAYIAMILIGGIDSIAGAVIGATIVICLPVVVPLVLGGSLGATATTHAPQISQIIYGSLVLLFIVSSPAGIVGWLRSRADRASALLEQRRQSTTTTTTIEEKQ
ncbi:branched-chain amino acid ABC transporter permease [Nocardia neocaledoniensis]|uniref:branched-chain amino acid ABC transporter permease n=1 Tax=Nocardia neocaledoniensis TaxID=236511 RepID=UPI002456876A|nr:branched-chain amino acid ABC transporter permease [Nocardia neocaledoniensis]